MVSLCFNDALHLLTQYVKTKYNINVLKLAITLEEALINNYCLYRLNTSRQNICFVPLIKRLRTFMNR
jgi:hypothetical protein